MTLPGTADAIVVLGCRVRCGGAASTAMRRRVDRGVQLFREGAAPLLVLSGGGASPVPEAEIMRCTMLALGVPEAALLVESGSRNTFENARNTAELLRSRGLCSVFLVSDRAHLPRARLLFRFAGLKVVGSVGASRPSLRWELAAALHECAALPKSVARVLLNGRSFRPSFRRSGKSRENAPEQQSHAQRRTTGQQE